MIFLLTGNVQIGKSRWLEAFVKELAEDGITSYGLISAGIWVEVDEDSNCIKSNGTLKDDISSVVFPEDNSTHTFEKIGIETILLPSGKRYEFAKREDLAKADGSYEKGSADSANLRWNIREDALKRANRHLAEIESQAAANRDNAILIVDELGRLELFKQEGLTEALRILFEGKCSTFHNAVVVVRTGLVEVAEEKFRNAGLETMRISPNEESKKQILSYLFTD